MSWYDGLNPVDKGDLGDAWGGVKNAFGVGSGDPTNPERDALRQNAGNAAGFAGQAQGNYNNMTAQGQQSIDALRALASGQNSVSAEQLRQGNQQAQAAQMSMAAGASPQNAAMAARNAAMNMGRQQYGLAGQQAVAGLQERNQAQQALANMIQGMRGQDLQGTLGGYGAANQGYGLGIGNPQKTVGGLYMQGLGAVGQVAQLGAASDRRLKADVEDGDSAAAKAIAGLKAFSFRYRDEKWGKGKQVGIMAQDMERAGLGHAVIDTPEGKMIHGGKAATAGLALVAALGRRVDRLEGGKK